MTVHAAVDGEHSNPITTVKPDVIVILRSDRGIVMGEWIKAQYTVSCKAESCQNIRMRMLLSCKKVTATSNRIYAGAIYGNTSP